MVQYYGSEFEIPDLLINKFLKDFSSLPGGSYREGVHQIRNSIQEITDMIAEAVVARKLETTGHDILKAIHPHPTMSEAVMEAVADAYGEVIHL